MTDERPGATCDFYDPGSPEHRADPYPAYARLRRAATPLFLEARGWWLISQYSDVRAALDRPEVFSSGVMRRADAALLGSDPPAHTEVRRRVDEAMRRAPVTAGWLRETAEALVRAMRVEGRCDLVASFARALPARVSARLLGIEEDRVPDLARWSAAFVPSGGAPDAGARQAASEMSAFFDELIDRRAREPSDDVIGVLARDGMERGALCSVAKVLLTGGNETTAHLLGNAVLALAREPSLQERAAAGEAECAKIVDESLRHEAPVQLVMRALVRETEVAGRRLPAGAIAALLLGSANRDERVFEAADRFDPDRRGRPHLAFGWGPHTCAGARLSRQEATIGLSALFRGARVRLGEDPSAINWTEALQLRGPSRLLVEVE